MTLDAEASNLATAMLTIAYLTNRKDCRIEWFFQSLANEVARTLIGWDQIKVVVVDYWMWYDTDNSRRDEFVRKAFDAGCQKPTHVPPAPTVWQGPHKLTKEDHFDAANTRNTALCYALDGYIVYVDDLSVLLPGWLDGVLEAKRVHYIACGAYRKVKDLVVVQGAVNSFTPFPAGDDNRQKLPQLHANCPPNWMYGCSFAAPVEALLAINGQPALWCAGMSYEDAVSGEALGRNGYIFRYDPRMMTYESEELHAQGKPFRRDDPGVSPNDKSHALLDKCRGVKSFPNNFGGGFTKLADLRQHILAGGSFPIPTEPTTEWFTGKPLCEL